ncbi:MAG: hypothetical protein ABUL60_20105 [Myxococcales bacterium]
MRALAVGLVALCVAAGCAQAPAPEGETEKPELSPQLKALVLDETPTDIAHPLYIDFNGRAELIGYAIDPEPQPGQKLAPGSQLSLKLYWRSTGKLDPGYVPFTELVAAGGARVEVDGTGPVRKGELVPSNWERGKVYVDELSFSVPPDLDTTRVSIVVGLKTEPVAPEAPAAEPEKADSKKADKKVDKSEEGHFGPVYLSVLSGPADSKHGGVLTSVETVRVPKDDKKQAGALKRLPAGKPVSAKPAARPLQPTQ